jgi:O-antigen/teichoic acid export membrane protein
LSNWATFIFAAGVNFVLSPFIVRSLGSTQYGAWVLLGSMVGHLGLLDIGVRAAVTRYIASFHTSGEHERATRLYSTALRIFSYAGVAAVVVSIVLSLLVGRVFNVPADLIEVAHVVVILGGFNIAASLVGGVYGGVLVGLERFDWNNGIEIVVATVRSIGVVVALETGQGLIGLAVVQLIATALRIVASVWVTRSLYPQLRLSSWEWDKESGRLLLTFGLTASLLHVSYAIMFYSDSLVIGAFLPMAMVTYFAIAGSLIDYARAVMSGITQTLTPRISALEAAGQDAALGSAMITSARISSIVIMPIAATFVVTGPRFIGLWMGAEYAQLAGTILRVITVPLIVLAGYQVVSAAMFGVGKHGRLIPVFIGEAVVNVVLSIFWVRKYGVLGTAYGTMIPRVIVSTIIGPWYARKAIGIHLPTFWKTVFVMPVLAMVPFAAVSYGLERAWPSQNIAVYFTHVAVLLPVAALGAWFLCVTEQERAMVRGLIGRRFAKRRERSSSGVDAVPPPVEGK